ncbi:MAG: hypothetical protein LUF82_01655 [Clostridia bacterium]|nr:hypothetical protein [Clostridia bacterium]
MIDTSTEAYRKLKSSLVHFRSNISGLSTGIRSDVDEAISSCRQKVSDQKSIVDRLEIEINYIEKQIKEYDEAYTFQLSETRKYTSDAKEYSKYIDYYNRLIDDVNYKIRNENPSCEDYNSNMESFKRDLEEYNSKLKYYQGKTSEYLGYAEKHKKKAEELKIKINKMESDFAEKKAQYNKEKEKYEHMVSDFNTIENDGNHLISCARNLECSAIDEADHDISCVDSCLQYLDEYLNS